MAFLILPSYRNKQPSGVAQLDGNNVLSSGLVCVPQLWLRGRDLLSPGRSITLQANSTFQGNAVGNIGLKGSGNDPQGLNIGTAGLGQIVSNASPVTIALGVIPFATGVREVFFADYSGAGSGASMIIEQTTGNVFRAVTTNGVANPETTTGTVAAGRHVNIAVVHDLSNIYLYENGVSPGGISAGFNRTAGTTLRLGAPGAYTGGIRFRGDVTYCYVWNRALSDLELAEINRNPWQIFRPIQRRIYVPSVGAGTNTYTYSGSGTVTLSGAATVARWRSYAGAGTVTLSGDAALARWRSYAGAGTVTMSGAATTALVPAGTTTYTYSGAGAVTISGAAAVARWRAWAGSGTVTLSGAATTAYTPGLVVYTYAGSGTITLSGAATTTGPLPVSRASAGGKSKGKRARTRIIRDEQLTAEDRRRLGVPEPQEAAPKDEQAPPQPKRARRTGKASRGIQLQPEADLEAQRAAEILAQRTAELMAQQQAATDAMRAEGIAMLQAAAAIEADNELMMLLLMAA